MKAGLRLLYVPDTEQQLSKEVGENISVVIKICFQPSYSGIYCLSTAHHCHLAMESKQFITELCSPGDRKC